MVDLDRRGEVARTQMVEALRRLGVADEPVLQVMASVPRHRFVDRFWAVARGARWTARNVREFAVDEGCSDETLHLLYDVLVAVATRGPIDEPVATSSVSAPVIVGSMLTEMALRHGLRVLEVGTGSGYNAALIAELVGDPSLVTTVEIDPTLVAEAVPRLERLGYGAIHVIGGDGTEGVAERAPFDRVVATVGCLDIAPAWIGQLAEGGSCSCRSNTAPCTRGSRSGNPRSGCMAALWGGRDSFASKVPKPATRCGPIRHRFVPTSVANRSRRHLPMPWLRRTPAVLTGRRICGTSTPTSEYVTDGLESATDGPRPVLASATALRWP